jgi:polyhydroxybutyrate depolymerase
MKPLVRVAWSMAGVLVACVASGWQWATAAPAAAVTPMALISAQCTARLPAGLQQLPVRSGGLERPMALFVPAAVTAGQPLALVFDLHGSGSNAEQQARSTQLRRLAQAEGFLVANPEGGVRQADAPEGRFWNIPGVPLVNGSVTPADAPDDVRFVGDAIDAVAAATCLDRQRVYVTGMSGGGRMASLLACQLADRIAAFAPVAGLRAGLAGQGGDRAPGVGACRPVRAVPILTFHGTDDRTNPYDGDATVRWGYSVPVAVRRWAQIDRCEAQPQVTRVSAHVVRESFSHCATGSEVVFYRTEAARAEGGGHVWPGGAAPGSGPVVPGADTGHDVDASRIIWTFFSQHRLEP